MNNNTFQDPQSGGQHNGNFSPPAGGKSKLASGLLAILVGLGIHNFYLGYIGKAVAQLALYAGGLILVIVGMIIMLTGIDYTTEVLYTGFWVGFAIMMISIIPLIIAGVWQLIEGIMILCGVIKVDGKGQPLV